MAPIISMSLAWLSFWSWEAWGPCQVRIRGDQHLAMDDRSSAGSGTSVEAHRWKETSGCVQGLLQHKHGDLLQRQLTCKDKQWCDWSVFIFIVNLFDCRIMQYKKHWKHDGMEPTFYESYCLVSWDCHYPPRTDLVQTHVVCSSNVHHGASSTG